MWLQMLASQDEVRRWRPLLPVLDPGGRPPVVEQGLQVWRGIDDIRGHLAWQRWTGVAYVDEQPAWVPGAENLPPPSGPPSRRLRLDDEAVALDALFTVTQLDWDQVAEIIGGPEPPAHRAAPEDCEVWVARRLSPVAVLLLGLGWERARLLPGVAGLYLLGADEARETLAGVETAFDLSIEEREDVLSRMALWREAGDEPDLELDRLLVAGPRLHRRAVARGLGILSCTTVTC